MKKYLKRCIDLSSALGHDSSSRRIQAGRKNRRRSEVDKQTSRRGRGFGRRRRSVLVDQDKNERTKRADRARGRREEKTKNAREKKKSFVISGAAKNTSQRTKSNEEEGRRPS